MKLQQLNFKQSIIEQTILEAVKDRDTLSLRVQLNLFRVVSLAKQITAN